MKKLLALSLTVVALGLFAIGCDTKPIAPKATPNPTVEDPATPDGVDSPTDEKK
ncbi:hypothetical protein FACS189454_02110 [Planctomycetales bacterium]|nr:hypothetical protein FACS189454_02110 [Planctomycetales bacterium]